MRTPTLETEQAICERLGRNRHEAKMRRMFADFRRMDVLDGIANPIKMECLVCGAPMEAQRVSKKTCSARCRLKWSRIVRAIRALPEAEQRKRDAELKKRWRRARAAATREEKRKPKRSLNEIADDIRSMMATLR